jgi:hypothetical protein
MVIHRSPKIKNVISSGSIFWESIKKKLTNFKLMTMNSGFNKNSEVTCTETSLIDFLPNDAHLLELSQFQFPSIPIDQLTQEPYISYVQLYKEMYDGLKFYRGFIRPNKVERAKIYRAIDLCCDDCLSIKDIIVFTTTEGLIIKCRNADDIEFNKKFDHYMSQEDCYVFIPEKCDRLDQYNYSYYRRMLNNFTLNEKILGKTFRMNEHDNVFLFVSLENPCVCGSECNNDNNKCENCFKSGTHGNLTLERKWKEYIQGGVLRRRIIPVEKISTALKVFEWSSRVKFRVSSNNIEITVKSSSLNDFEKCIRKIEIEPPVELKYIDVGFDITDEYEAFGIIRILREKINSVSNIIPIMGTSRIYFSADLSEDFLSIINEYQVIDPIPEGNETFTQDEFNNMSKWRHASLIKAPSNHLYSFLDLYQNLKGTPTSYDPLTREEFKEDFKSQMDRIRQEVDGIFMSGFPPIKFNPELITIVSEPNTIIRTISFYIKIGNEVNAFWIIPDLRDTEFGKITLEAIRILVVKWTDRSLFKSSFSEANLFPDGDIHLIFSPVALYVFEQTISNLTIENYPKDIKAQARYLQDQIFLLRRCN